MVHIVVYGGHGGCVRLGIRYGLLGVFNHEDDGTNTTLGYYGPALMGQVKGYTIIPKGRAQGAK